MVANTAFTMRHIYGKYILMPTRKNEASDDPVLLNEVAASIWESALYPVKSAGIVEKISEIYGLRESSPEVIAVEQFISQMVDMGLLLKTDEEM